MYTDPFWIHAKVIALTLSTKVEIDTNPIIKMGIANNKTIVVPKVYPDRQMKFIRLSNQSRFKSDIFGIPEPVNGKIINKAQIDLVIVPGLAFAINTGDRIGFGGGYYDRYLNQYHGNKIALAKSFQVFENPLWKINQFDIKVNRIIF
ncbi:5-formyltetrahydrofolate cyclo-ligase [Philodulcilactobacillus myokoensis]|uniref:5-formyltetrahydrofolate cyclo-ligase n=1 Tax=Philodulcilactobacillus myokoensis TaxID=2929573 RepID=A0A9W6B0Z3_9LACO|nr:5-formyltetrahydrofolate cyclo-ligase [Philodulcilactobacillus myokoensis]